MSIKKYKLDGNRKKAIDSYYKNPNRCKFCGEIIHISDTQSVRSVRQKQYCNRSCAGKVNGHRTKLVYNGYLYDGAFVKKTKGELFSSRKNWQSARSNIQRHARRVYFDKVTDTSCCRDGCNYSLHVDVAHIKSVSSFNDETLISEINDISNLMGLCKNCHWEFDNDIITMDDIKIYCGMEK